MAYFHSPSHSYHPSSIQPCLHITCAHHQHHPILPSRGSMLASESIPSGNVDRKSNVSKESGTYIITPQPKDLPEGWEQAVAVNPDGKTGSFIFHKYVLYCMIRYGIGCCRTNHLLLHSPVQDLIQFSDPRPRRSSAYCIVLYCIVLFQRCHGTFDSMCCQVQCPSKSCHS